MAGTDDGQADPLSSATQQIGETTKWLITIFAGVAGVLLAGSQLSSIGKLAWGLRLFGALVGMVVALAGTAFAIWFAVEVLAKQRVELHEFAESKDANDQRLLRENPALLLGLENDAQQLDAAYPVVLKARAEATTNYEQDPTDGEKQVAATFAEAKAQRYSQAVGGVLSAVRYDRVSRAFQTAKVMMFVGALVTAVGIALFAWAANPTTPASGSEAIPPNPVPARIALTQAGRDALSRGLGKECVNNPRGVSVIALSDAPNVDVVTIARKSCKVARFTVTPDIGVVTGSRRVHPSPSAMPSPSPLSS